MRLVVGGFAQGKLAYVLETYGYTEEDVFDVQKQTLSEWKGQPVIYHGECLVTRWLESGQEPQRAAQELCPRWKDTVLILQEVGCGLVPMTAEQRTWRENVGRVSSIFAAYAETVERVCCGLGMKLKGA